MLKTSASNSIREFNVSFNLVELPLIGLLDLPHLMVMTTLGQWYLNYWY